MSYYFSNFRYFSASHWCVGALSGMLFLGGVLLFTHVSNAAAGIPSTFGANIAIGVTPKYPEPNENVTLTLGGSPQLNFSDITWFRNGAIITSGQGAVQYRYKTGALGSSETITAIIVEASGKTQSVSKTIRPTDITLLWEGQSLVPPLYRGRALPGADSAIAIEAFPAFVGSNGVRIRAKDLVYTWSINGEIQTDNNGGGRSSIVVTNSRYFAPLEVDLTVASTDGMFTQRKILTIPMSDPILRLYEDKPLGGVQYEHAIGNEFSLATNETTVVALPYYFPEGPLIYGWRVNDRSYDLPDTSRAIVLRIPEKESGATKISTRVQSSTISRVQAYTDVTVSFAPKQ